MLVIGYGNTLRSDDGAGQVVAEKVQKQAFNGVKTISVHQLTPELAENISHAQRVIFVDAVASEMAKIQVIKLKPEQSKSGWGHTINPRSLLFLSQTLYHKTPPAWWILIPGVNFELGEKLSPLTQNCILEAVKEIEQLI